MIDFIIGFILGKKNNNLTIPKVNNIDIIIPKEEKIEVIVPKVTKYVFIPEIFNLPAKLEDCYNDYDKTNLVCIFRENKIYYYLEIEVPIAQTKWGKEDLLDNI